MVAHTEIFVRLAPGSNRPWPGQCRVNRLSGGPETLLRWLETQLGLPVPTVHNANRIAEYAAALDTVAGSAIDASMNTDRWATASELLSRRDDLLLAGWDESDSDALPDIVRDLARAASGRTLTFSSEASRLLRVLDALQTGQVLTPHRCHLYDLQDRWPVTWRRVLSKLHVVEHVGPVAHGPEGSALHSAQTLILGHNVTAIELDSTFRYVHTRSESAAVDFVVAALAEATEKLSKTVIYCEDDELALRLDACLNRVGLPTTGATAWSRAHPALQVLPLSLALCWDPVDPQALLDFLTLPIQPIPKTAARRLAKALTQEPGLGSRAWDVTYSELCEEVNDADGKLRALLDDWLLCERSARGSTIPPRSVRARCNMVAQWAYARALLLAQDEQPISQMFWALKNAAGQASLLGELAESHGEDLSEPQLSRLLEEALAKGIEIGTHLEADGGPVRVRSLAEIDGPCERMIWLGVATTNAKGCRWQTNQLLEMRKAGIDIDNGSKVLSSLRSAEARGYCYVTEAFLAVLLPRDLEERSHPIWLAIHGVLKKEGDERPPVLEELVALGDPTILHPFTIKRQHSDFENPQKLRPLWSIPAGLLSDIETVSATELQDRLACPLKWTLNYQAKLRPSSIAELPRDLQLKGTFSHSLLERVFGGGGELPSPDEAAVRVVAEFDHRLPLDAAPLALPHKLVESQRLRGEVENAARVLVATLAGGGYQIDGFEVEMVGDAFRKRMVGRLDCLVKRKNGEEAVIDFKYGGKSKYHSLLEDGRAVQLATYAYSRSLAGGSFPAVAYVVLSHGLFYTPSGSPVQGAGNRSIIDAPAIQAVWENFSRAIENADGWLHSLEPVPARPLQDASLWPHGATIVLDDEIKANEGQDVCTYCDYKRICGMQETT
jgi:ATP-dependent helicase/nuclease subunit B